MATTLRSLTARLTTPSRCWAERVGTAWPAAGATWVLALAPALMTGAAPAAGAAVLGVEEGVTGVVVEEPPVEAPAAVLLAALPAATAARALAGAERIAFPV